jgi:hypothetical protein
VRYKLVRGKRPANRASRFAFSREIMCPLTGKLRGTYGYGYGACGSGATAAVEYGGKVTDR